MSSLEDAMKEVAGKPGRPPRILIFDIETVPHEAYVWGMWQQNVAPSQLKSPGHPFAFSAKWFGERTVMFYSDHHDGHEAMVRKCWELLSEADIVVTYNGKSFDIPRMQTEFLLAGLGPAKPFQQIDLLKIVRKQFSFASNKLDYVCQQLGLGSKTSHEGFDLWLKCMAGDEKAWRKMMRYAKQDVRLTEALYVVLLPWLTSAPHIGQLSGTDHSCPNCGSTKLVEVGTASAFVTTYILYRCKNCTTWVRGTLRLQETTHTRAQKIN